MKKSYVFRSLTAILLTLALLSSLATVPLSAEEPEHRTFHYVALGDSIAAGYNVWDGDHYTNESCMRALFVRLNYQNSNPDAYPALVADGLRTALAGNGYLQSADDFSFSNLGAAGYRVQDFIDALSPENPGVEYVPPFWGDRAEMLTDVPPNDWGDGFPGKFLTPDGEIDMTGTRDIIVSEIGSANLITVQIGANDLLIDFLDELDERGVTNPLFAVISATLGGVFISYMDTDAIIAQLEDYVSNTDAKQLEQDLSEVLAFFMPESMESMLLSMAKSAMEDYETLIGLIREINPDAQIVPVGQYHPFGSSLECDGHRYTIPGLVNLILDRLADATGTEMPTGEPIPDPQTGLAGGLFGGTQTKLSEFFGTWDEYRTLCERLLDDPAGWYEVFSAVSGLDEATQEQLLTDLGDDLLYPLGYLLLGGCSAKSIDYFNDAVRELIASEQFRDLGMPFVDVSGIPNEKGLDPHPLKDGHAYIAEQILDTVLLDAEISVTGSGTVTGGMQAVYGFPISFRVAPGTGNRLLTLTVNGEPAECDGDGILTVDRVRTPLLVEAVFAEPEPTEQDTDPTEQNTDPTGQGTDPTEQNTEPTEQSTKPAQNDRETKRSEPVSEDKSFAVTLLTVCAVILILLLIGLIFLTVRNASENRKIRKLTKRLSKLSEQPKKSGPDDSDP